METRRERVCSDRGESPDWRAAPDLVVTSSDLDALGVKVGGSYNLAMDTQNNRIYLGVNLDPTENSGFGEVVLLVIGLG